jgi:DNA-binding NtrC family response regulator
VLLSDGASFTVGGNTINVSFGARKWLLYPSEENEFLGLVGQSAAMRNLFTLIQQMATYDIPILVNGETGTGKELVTRAIHAASPRAKSKYMVLDCGSVVKDLLRSELFGHERGAFTGADRDRVGIFQAADGGTVVLDEAGEIDLSLQPTLLRVLESREVTRIGSHKSVPVNVRLVASTNRDLLQMAREGTFRSDLYYRLAATTISIPALRDRKEDIPLLAARFAKSFCTENRLTIPEFGPDVLTRLEEYDWPGNVRQLRNVIQTLSVLGQRGPVDPAQLDSLLGIPQTTEAVVPVSHTPAVAPASHIPEGKELEAKMMEAEREILVETLEALDWNREQVARRLGMSRTTLYKRMLRHGLTRPRGA